MKKGTIVLVILLILFSALSTVSSAFYYDFDYGNFKNAKYHDGYYRNMAGYSPGWNTYEGMYRNNFYSGYSGNNRDWYGSRTYTYFRPGNYGAWRSPTHAYRPTISRTYHFR
ncbi:hypothetical protein HN419_00615 [Candidatus Woesearchaeota archaeon]|nr:hypothetical protein [Candidatus Woesearchaeota archaeon]MBT3537501.1 hypothetical protein [Candidatus Woesearchaeota archaeon]MBT4696805.1 hypothetical protein [Candidatus Woesearchaeota archaeon]MBT4717626.1 hypothetical protein [Candidatus Woesearchaeota archaeon]MBT7106189.1 hypothetical protein [Candidatus Woesearchaeota archaeon]